MRETEQRASVIARELNRHYRLGTSGRCGDPCYFDDSIAIQPEEPTVVRVPRAFEVSFEEEGGVGLGLHQNRARGSKPAIELFRSRAEQQIRGCQHGAFAGEAKRPCRKIRQGDNCH